MTCERIERARDVRKEVELAPASWQRYEFLGQLGSSQHTVSSGFAGLQESSVALCHQVTTPDRNELRGRIGTLGSEGLAAVESGLKAALALV